MGFGHLIASLKLLRWAILSNKRSSKQLAAIGPADVSADLPASALHWLRIAPTMAALTSSTTTTNLAKQACAALSA